MDHPDQRPDADPLQDRHHRQRRRRITTSPVFLLASIVTRGARFFIVAALLRFYGEPIRDFIERRLTLVTTAFVLLLVGGFVFATLRRLERRSIAGAAIIVAVMTIPPSIRRRPFLIAVGSLAALAIAFGSQYFGGLQPCVLCIYQRYPYGVVIALGMLGMILAWRPALLAAILRSAALAFFVDAGIAAFHVGVEQHWWEGTSECSGMIDPNLQPRGTEENSAKQPVVRCDAIAWQHVRHLHGRL